MSATDFLKKISNYAFRFQGNIKLLQKFLNAKNQKTFLNASSCFLYPSCDGLVRNVWKLASISVFHCDYHCFERYIIK